MKKILIADDSGMARMFVKRCLEAIGFRTVEFVEAENGQDALDKIDADPVDLIVTDLTMPVMDGESLLKKIKGESRYAALPVLVISSAGNPAREAELRKNGALAVLAKPFTPADLYKVLHEFIPEG
ncbi:MAG: response regulator [Desulfobulbaceae bacterium]|nr:response regulator [Desulfobulbaceae bacterium]